MTGSFCVSGLLLLFAFIVLPVFRALRKCFIDREHKADQRYQNIEQSEPDISAAAECACNKPSGKPDLTSEK